MLALFLALGSPLLVQAAAADTGYQLQAWTGCDNNASLTCTFAGIREDKSEIAQFAKQLFTVTAQVSPADAGSITCEAMHIAYGEGTTCTVHPAAGYVVNFIRGCDSKDGLVCQLSGVTGNRNVTAELVKQQYSITAQVSSPYLGSLICETNRIGFGDSTTCTAAAEPGARFTGFGVDSVCAASATAAPETCVLQNVTSDLAVFAHFEPYFSALTVPAVGEPATASASFTGGGADCRLDLSRTAFVAAPGSLPNGQTMPHGMLDFKLIGCNSTPVTVSIAWPNAVQGLTKWGKASIDATSPSYFQPSDLVVAGKTTTFTVQDGQLGDDDWTTNGVIVDPVGATVPAALAQAVPVPTLGYLALALMGLIVAGLGLRGLHQR
ncbi:choice-of-anchor U domain-containing protein [Lampropedia aestuarii]|uniref:choice-of-anchor U domain-containing protein n=1 Tax=Lampropedia aestuarii TaxID=2562762 RepID=UPI002468B8F9|nr:choice-of-anchor U domain-containing protein [Lampropedia aestuarii]MDH5856999.1 hypothetical protein [Lampropedia aestuarii]